MIIPVTVATAVMVLLMFGGIAYLFKRPREQEQEDGEEGTWSPEELVALAAQPDVVSEVVLIEEYDGPDGVSETVIIDEYSGPDGVSETVVIEEYAEPALESGAEALARLSALAAGETAPAHAHPAHTPAHPAHAPAHSAHTSTHTPTHTTHTPEHPAHPTHTPAHTPHPTHHAHAAPPPILRVTREDVLYYAAEILSTRLGSLLSDGKPLQIEIFRRAKPALPDILTANNRVFALLFEKSNVLKLYLRAGTQRIKELKARYGSADTALPGGFYGWIVDARMHSKETIYGELEEACAYAAWLEKSDARMVSRLRALLDEAAETDAFRKNEAFRHAIRERTAANAQYGAEHGVSAVTRDELLRQIDRHAGADQTRTEPDPERPSRAVAVSVGGKPYMRLYDRKSGLHIRANIPFEYSVELSARHLVGKAGRRGTWYDIVVDDTFAGLPEVYAIAERAKSHTQELAFMATLNKKGKGSKGNRE